MPEIDTYAVGSDTARAIRALALGTINAQVGTTYTILASDNGNTITLSNTSPIALTVPSGLGADFQCRILQVSTGQVTVSGSGATVNAYSGWVKLAGQHAGATLIATAANVFNLSGNLTA
jgi:hypothetical protein